MNYIYKASFNELWLNSPDNGLIISEVNIKEKESLSNNCFALNNQNHLSSPAIILPDLNPYILVHFMQDGTMRFRIIGPRTKAVKVNRKRRKHTFLFKIPLLHFYQFTSMPLSEICDQSMDVSALMGQEFHGLLVNQISQDHPEEFFSTLFRHLHKKIVKESQIAQYFVQKSAGKNVHQAAKDIGISTRYLQKIIKRELGMVPKMVQKVSRLHQSLQSKTQNAQQEWVQVGLEAGYYDQSHMIADYQAFLQKTPGEIF